MCSPFSLGCLPVFIIFFKVLVGDTYFLVHQNTLLSQSDPVALGLWFRVTSSKSYGSSFGSEVGNWLLNQSVGYRMV